VPSGAQNWLREPASEKARVLRCRPAAQRLAAELLEDRGARVVHAGDHGGGAAGAGEALHDQRGAARAVAEAADLDGGDQAEQAGLAERGDGGGGELGVRVELDGAGGDDFGGDLLDGSGDVDGGLLRHDAPGARPPGDALSGRAG
jgi:hypothetical protein